MKALKLISCLLLMVALLAGCWIDETETVLSNPKDRVFPLKTGRYFDFEPLSSNYSRLTQDEIKNNLSQKEQAIFLSNKFVPQKKRIITLEKLDNCYLLRTAFSPASETYSSGVLEEIQDDIYLMEVFDSNKKKITSCKKQGDAGAFHYFVSIKDGYIHFLSHKTFEEGFMDWLLTLNKITRWWYGVSLIQKEGEDGYDVKLTGTNIYKLYYKQKAKTPVNSNYGYAVYSDEEINKYKEEIALDDKIRDLKQKKKEERKAEEERKKAAEAEKARIAEEKRNALDNPDGYYVVSPREIAKITDVQKNKNGNYKVRLKWVKGGQQMGTLAGTAWWFPSYQQFKMMPYTYFSNRRDCSGYYPEFEHWTGKYVKSDIAIGFGKTIKGYEPTKEYAIGKPPDYLCVYVAVSGYNCNVSCKKWIKRGSRNSYLVKNVDDAFALHRYLK